MTDDDIVVASPVHFVHAGVDPQQDITQRRSSPASERLLVTYDG